MEDEGAGVSRIGGKVAIDVGRDIDGIVIVTLVAIGKDDDDDNRRTDGRIIVLMVP